MKQVMSMLCCCNFWPLISSSLDSSDCCPSPLTREAQKPQCSTQLLSCARFQKKDWESPKILNYIIPHDGNGLCTLPDPSKLLPLISILLHSLITGSPPLDKKNPKTTKQTPKALKTSSKMLPEEYFLHQNTSSSIAALDFSTSVEYPPH